MDELKGKVALITGAGRGFGRAIGERFAEAGATLALNYRASADGCASCGSRTRSRIARTSSIWPRRTKCCGKSRSSRCSLSSSGPTS